MMRHFIPWFALWFFGAVGTVAQVAVPPQLVRPIQGAQLPSPLVQFEWTPSSPPAPGLAYRLTVKPRYQGQTPTQAMASNPVSLQVDVPGTSYQTSLSEANALGADAVAPNYAGHVWHVQALLNGQPYGDNQGFSQIEGFTVPAMAIDPVKPPYAGLMWELPYTVLIDGGAELTCDLPANVGDTLIMIVRVQAPQKLTEDTLTLLQGANNASPSARYTGYVLNQAIASGAGRASGKTLGAVTRQAPPRGQGRGPIIPLRPSDVGLPAFRTEPGDMLDGSKGDTLRTDRRGGYFIYRIPDEEGKPPVYAGFMKNWAHEVRKEISAQQRSDALTVPHTIFYPEDELQPASMLRQWAYNAMKEGTIIVDQRVQVGNATVKPSAMIAKKTAALVGGTFIPTHLLLPICPIAIAESDAFPEPMSDILVAVDEESGAIEYRWLALRRELTQIQAVIRLDCERDFYPIR